MKINVFIIRPKNLVRLRAQTSETRFLSVFLVNKRKTHRNRVSPHASGRNLRNPVSECISG